MASALKSLSTDNIIKFLLFGLVVLFALTKVIDFANIGVEGADVFIAPGEDQIIQIFAWIILAIAVWVTWKWTNILEGRLDRKKLITLFILGIGLFVLYKYIVQPLCVGISDACPLPELFESAALLKMAVVP